jgi:uncharacterized protein YfaS (alpha-2-macroglobulin family)
MRPDDKRTPGLVQWLLFNRKGNEWKSTKASAGALFALLDVLEQRGALTTAETIRWQWAGQKQTITLKATAPLTSALRWTKNFSDRVPASQSLSLGASITKEGPGFAFASLTTRFSTEEILTKSDGQLLRVERSFFRRESEGEGKYRLTPLNSGDAVAVGEEIEAHYTVTSRAAFSYVQLRAPRGGGFEAEETLSGWRWDTIGRYEETRDSLSQFFLSWVPQGEYVLRHRWRATTPGTYRIPSAQIQSVYAPEVAGYSSGIALVVKEDKKN